MRPLLLATVLLGSATLAYNMTAPVRPDPAKTPGDALTSDPKVVCVPGYTKTVRNVPQALKEAVYREYGITHREPGEYEVDHLISLELGGSNSVRNLWPESYKTMPLNAHVKDTLENRLHDLACSGRITLQEAQQAIAHDWTAAYTKYVGPLPGGETGAVPALPVDQSSTPDRAPTLPSTPGAVQPGPDGACPPSAPVKVSRSGVYHLPTGDPNYERTHAVSCYPDAPSAQAAGFRGIR